MTEINYIRSLSAEQEAWIEAWRLRIFRDTFILVFVNENCCLCICFTELYFFYWLLVVSLVILIALPFVFSHSVNIACRSTQNTAHIKRFWRLHINKTIKWKININKFFIILERNSINVHSNIQHSSHCKSENWLAVYAIFEIFLTVWLTAHACFDRPKYWNECNLYSKIVKYCILSEVCTIKTVPHSTVSPPMWCINGIKGQFTLTQICWQDFLK